MLITSFLCFVWWLIQRNRWVRSWIRALIWLRHCRLIIRFRPRWYPALLLISCWWFSRLILWFSLNIYEAGSAAICSAILGIVEGAFVWEYALTCCINHFPEGIHQVFGLLWIISIIERVISLKEFLLSLAARGSWPGPITAFFRATSTSRYFCHIHHLRILSFNLNSLVSWIFRGAKRICWTTSWTALCIIERVFARFGQTCSFLEQSWIHSFLRLQNLVWWSSSVSAWTFDSFLKNRWDHSTSTSRSTSKWRLSWFRSSRTAKSSNLRSKWSRSRVSWFSWLRFVILTIALFAAAASTFCTSILFRHIRGDTIIYCSIVRVDINQALLFWLARYWPAL